MSQLGYLLAWSMRIYDSGKASNKIYRPVSDVIFSKMLVVWLLLNSVYFFDKNNMFMCTKNSLLRKTVHNSRYFAFNVKSFLMEFCLRFFLFPSE